MNTKVLNLYMLMSSAPCSNLRKLSLDKGFACDFGQTDSGAAESAVKCWLSYRTKFMLLKKKVRRMIDSTDGHAVKMQVEGQVTALGVDQYIGRRGALMAGSRLSSFHTAVETNDVAEGDT